MIADPVARQNVFVRAKLHHNKAVRQWFEAASKVHGEQAVAQMLPIIMGDCLHHSMTALHLAARYDDEMIAAQLLTEEPSLADVTDRHHLDALRTAATFGSEKVVAVLLAKTPRVIHAVIKIAKPALHFAAEWGHDKVVAQLLAADPNLANAVDGRGWTPMHYAASRGREVVVDMLLAVNPQLIFAVGKDGTVLHLACYSRSRNKDFFARLLELNPGALRAVDSDSHTPFGVAVAYENDSAVEVLQWKLTIEDIVHTFTIHNSNNKRSYRPIVEGQCECLVASLSRDVVGLVFEYLFKLPNGLKT